MINEQKLNKKDNQFFFDKLIKISHEKNCSILIQSTNSKISRGVLHQCVAGKTLNM